MNCASDWPNIPLTLISPVAPAYRYSAAGFLFSGHFRRILAPAFHAAPGSQRSIRALSLDAPKPDDSNYVIEWVTEADLDALEH
jgi:hypothetical protein